MTLELAQLPYDRLRELEPIWLPYVVAIANRQKCAVEQRLTDVYSGNVALIFVWDKEANLPRALIGWSSMQRGPDRIAKLVWLIGIGAKDWLHLYDDLERLFRGYGFAGMAALARPGWSRFLRSNGYRLVHVEYEKDF